MRAIWVRCVAVASLVAAVTFVAPPIAAVAAPGVSLGKTASGQVRAGEPITYTLTATNPTSNPDATVEYNLSYTDVLPAGVTYVPGSTSVNRIGEPQVISGPGAGQTTLVWANVADIVAGGSFTLTFQATPDPTLYPVGATVPNPGAKLYANTDPQEAPRFDASGTVVGGTFTESASSNSTVTTISALDLSKSEPSPEGELLRGVHDHPTVYTLTATQAQGGATNGAVLVDYLPASLEFLGCGGVDNSSAPEYAGAPSLTTTPTPAGCVNPSSVTTVQNPAGHPAGIYTRVQWNIGTIAAGATVTRTYAAGVPLHANVMWPATPPTGLGQVANLDNNTGPSSRETTSEASATNTATITGTYDGPVVDGGTNVVDVDADESVSIEDLRMHKSVSPGTFSAGSIATYTLVVDASEYVSAGFQITDTIPSGVCPLGGPGTNYGGIPDCAGSVATAPSIPYESVTPNPDGTFTVVFDPQSFPSKNGTLTITYQGFMLETYLDGPREGEPTTTGDEFTNTATVAGTTTPIASTGETGTQAVTDESSATQETSGPSIDKTMLARADTTGACPTDVGDYGHPADLPPGSTDFRLGDLVCFALEVAFPGTSETRNPTVADFLPPGFELVNGSVRVGDGSTAPSTFSTTPNSVIWELGAPPGNDRFVDQGAIFRAVLQARVTDATALPAGEVRQNQMKLSIEDANGASATFRRSIDVTIAAPPAIGLVKGVESVDVPASGPNAAGSNVDGSLVGGGSVATFRIDLTNNGAGATAAPAGAFDVWDVLPAGITCADVDNVRGSPAPADPLVVACTDPGDGAHPVFAGSDALSLLRVTTVLDPDGATVDEQVLDPGERLSLLYDVTIPTPAGVSHTYTNTAYLHSFQVPTDVGTAATYYPQDNIDPSIPDADQLAQPASDPSNVRTPGVTVAKTGTTSITETNNNAANQATVGETVSYTYAATVPAHTSIFSGVLSDPLPAAIVIVPPATLTYFPDATSPTTAPVPAGVTINPATGEVTFPATYENTTGTNQRFAVTLTVRVDSAALPAAQNNIVRTNTARFESLSEPGGSALPPITASYPVTLRQPAPAITKTNNLPLANGGDTVTFTITASNGSTNRTPLHDAFITDCIPSGLTFQAYGPSPGRTPVGGSGANGCAVGTTLLVWQLDDLAPGASVTRTYTASVPPNAVGGVKYTNTAVLTGSSLDDNKTDPLAADNPLERSYAVSASSSVTIAGADLVKTVTPERAPVGATVTYTVTVDLPPNTLFFDGALVDQRPAGIGNIQLQSFSCVILSTPQQACPQVFTPNPLTPVPQPDGSVLTANLIGDVPAVPNVRRFTITYTGLVTDVPANVAGRVATNTAHAAWNTVNGSTPTRADNAWTQSGGPGSASVTVLEPNVTTTKSVSDTTPEPTDVFTYTVTLTNANTATSSAAYRGYIRDVVPVGVVVDPATISNGGTIAGADPVNGGGTISWNDLGAGQPLAPGAFLGLTYDAKLAPSTILTGAGLTNTATNLAYDSVPTDPHRTYAGGSATATVTPDFPRLTTTKAAVDPAPAYLGDPFTWRVTVTNTGGATAFGVDVTDLLPVGWTYEDGTARVSVAGGPAVAEEPVTLGRVLTWQNEGTLQPGQAVVVTFQATPGSSVVSTPGVGSTVPQVNTASGAGEDATGATGNASGPYSAGSTTAQTRIDSADLTLTKTHVDPVVAGGRATWQVTVTNAGADTAVGPFSVTDTLPSGVTFSSATGTGWSCSRSGVTVTCTRTNANETLAPGASLPVITVVTDVAADTASGTTFTNAATATDRTYDPDLSNNTDTDTATVTTQADLAVAKAHAAPLLAGARATWTLDVTNLGPSVALAPVTVTDTLPAGTTFVSAAGSGWACTGAGTALTCTRAADLPVGPAPQITVRADVDPDVTGTLENTAHVESPTTDPVPGNNTDVDPGAVVTLANLAIDKSHNGPFTAGSSNTYLFTVHNAGPSDAAGPVTITDTLPDVLTYTGFTSVTGTWACSASGQDVTCTLAAGLANDADAAVRIDVDVAADAPPEAILNTAHVGSPTTDPIPANNTDDDNTDVDVTSDLAVTKSHTGPATAGEDFSWQVDVTNNGPSDNPGPVTASDTLPPRTSYVSATGTGWDCSAVGRIVTCTRDGVLAAGEDAAPITITAAVASDAGPTVLLNSVSVSGTAHDDDLSNNSDSDPTIVLNDANVSIAKTRLGPATVPAGSTVTYELDVANEGPSDADGIVVSDTAPAGLRPVSVTPPTGQGWDCLITGQLVRCTNDSAPVGASATITVDAVTDPSAPDGTTLTNTATIATSTSGDDPADNTDTATVTTAREADLRLTKTHEPAGVAAAGEPVTFRIAVRNAGPSIAVGTLTVVDTLPDGLTFVSAASPWSCTDATPGPSQVTCTYTPAEPIPPNGNAPPLLMTVQVDAAAPAGTYTNEATVSGEVDDPTPSNNTDTDDVPVQPVANVSVTKTHTGTAHIGDDTTFQIAAHNDGPSQAQDVVVTDLLPSGLTLVSASGTGWTCATPGNSVRCVLDDPLDPTATTEPIDVVTTVGPLAYPSVANTARVTTSTSGDDPDDNDAVDSLAVPAQVDLSIRKAHTGDFVVGEQATWRILVHNSGPTPDPGPIVVADTLPAGVTYVSGSGNGWRCAAVRQAVRCVNTGGLAIDQSRLVSIKVMVEPSAYPAVVNSATVRSPAEDLDPANNTDTDPADIIPVSHLTIAKDVIDQDGGRVTFGIVVTNHGPSATTTPVVVTDPMPAGATLVGFTGSGWQCTSQGQTATCTYAAPLASGASTPRLSIVADLDTTAQPVVNTATVTGGQPDPCPDCGDSDDASASNPPALLPDQAGSGLPRTGANVGLTVQAALVLLGCGFVMVAGTRRRRPAKAVSSRHRRP
ncbi:hypothetical protein [Angustibacter luteus]|uniref:DUF11 domain-containing protein n=1 Tax=Angustibacter luteus TaxID=658456 RepID=A0ABW1JJL1_9ACTN